MAPDVCIELYGLPRARAGVDRLLVQATTLGEALRQLAARCPALRDVCVTGDRLEPGYVANINGLRFTADPATPIAAGDAILILSADAGG